MTGPRRAAPRAAPRCTPKGAESQGWLPWEPAPDGVLPEYRLKVERSLRPCYSPPVAKEARKFQRAQAERPSKPKLSGQADMSQLSGMQDPLGGGRFKQLLMRLGLPLAAVWVVGIIIAGFLTSPVWISVALGIPGLLTLAGVGLVLFTLRQAKKAQGVMGILSRVKSDEDRKAAMDQLDAANKKGKDAAAVFAKAQLQMQDDPRAALQTLETINLDKVMAPVADEARGQRAMIHLMLGEVTPARDLVDRIEIKRQQDPKSRAMLGSVVAEAWARSGQAKKGLDTLELFNPEDPEFEQVRPQIYRARAYVYAHTGKIPQMRRSLKKLLDADPRLLGGFMMKRTHPLLQKEARKMIERSGAAPRKMVIQRG